ncbi:Poly [ADP-ribose] polymerase 1, partial [Zootermopsis nevadensis]
MTLLSLPHEECSSSNLNPQLVALSLACYWLFQFWGHIGTTIGGKKLEEVPSLKQALQKFEKIYKEKTGNNWCRRHIPKKVHDCYYLVNVDYSQ